MTIWWCEEHEAAGVVLELDPSPDLIRCHLFHHESGSNVDCRMVQMDLVPHETSLTGVTIEGVNPKP